MSRWKPFPFMAHLLDNAPTQIVYEAHIEPPVEHAAHDIGKPERSGFLKGRWPCIGVEFSELDGICGAGTHTIAPLLGQVVPGCGIGAGRVQHASDEYRRDDAVVVR